MRKNVKQLEFELKQANLAIDAIEAVVSVKNDPEIILFGVSLIIKQHKAQLNNQAGNS